MFLLIEYREFQISLPGVFTVAEVQANFAPSIESNKTKALQRIRTVGYLCTVPVWRHYFAKLCIIRVYLSLRGVVVG